MTEKTKDTFNLANKQVYKYNIVKKMNEKIDKMALLNSIQINADTLNGQIDEFYYISKRLSPRLTIHQFQFTINE